MRTILAYLAAAALTLHVLLGCCLHHDHAVCVTGSCCELHHDDAAACEDQGPRDDHDGHDHDGHDHLSTTEHGQEHQHKPAEPCPSSCGDRCVFVSTVRVQLEQPFDLATFDLSLLALPQVTANLRLGGTRFEAHDATADPPPLRLHLRQQRLLI